MSGDATVRRECTRAQQKYTHRGGVRPFGISSLIGGYDNKGKPALYQTDPSGAYFSWKAAAIGKNSKTVTDFLEKKYEAGMDEEATLKLTIKALLEVTEASSDNIEVVVINRDGPKFVPTDRLDPLLKLLDDSAERMAKLKQEN